MIERLTERLTEKLIEKADFAENVTETTQKNGVRVIEKVIEKANMIGEKLSQNKITILSVIAEDPPRHSLDTLQYNI